jgi:nucleotide-binding universal stress UspA family protein
LRIVEYAHNGRFDLIMMPTHGYGPFRRFLLGSVTAKVLHDAGCPVWTSAHLENWPVVKNVMLRRILCGVDFGPRSCAALTCASHVAAEFNANLTVAYAVPFDTSMGNGSSQECHDRTASAAEQRIRKITEELGVTAAVEILEGSPAFALSEAAERLDADLIVIGRTHVAESFGKLGGNAYSIIAHSPSPVLSV